MAASCPAPDERARKNLATIFRALSSLGQARLAEALNVSEPTISRWKSEQAEQCAKALAALGLKVVPEVVRCYQPKTIDAILELARARLDNVRSAEDLEWTE